MEALILDLTEDQIVKTDTVEISGRLQNLAREVSSLSERTLPVIEDDHNA